MCVLLSKKSKVGLDRIEQDGDHRRDAAEMAGPGCAFKFVGRAFDHDVSRKARRINLFHGRRKNIIDIVFGQQRGIARQIARVSIEIFRRTELGRIYKDRNHDNVTHRAGFVDQTEVAFMQRAHRRDKADGPVLLAAQFAGDGHHALAAVDDFHKAMATKRHKRRKKSVERVTPQRD